MHKYLAEYPPAPPDRVADAKKLFPYQTMSPEEYATREGHNWFCFSFGEYIYGDPQLNEWIHTLDDIFFTPGRLTEVRQQYLSPEEIKQAEESERDF